MKFLEWKDTEEFNRQDYYLAQIAAQVERGQVKNPSSVTVEGKLIKFVEKKDVEKKEETEEEQNKKVVVSKSFWLGATGVKKKEEKEKKPKIRKTLRRRRKNVCIKSRKPPDKTAG